MARQQLSTETNTRNDQNTSHGLAQADITSFFGTMGGVVVGVLIALGMTGPMVRSQVADATKDLNTTLASSNTTSGSCVGTSTAQVAGGSGSGTVAMHTNPALPEGGRGGDTTPTDGGKGGDTWVEKWVGNQWVSNESTIGNTGADSKNSISTVNKNTTTVTNTNHVNATNNNPQTATSGSASTSKNTEGGNATSGAATNNSDASFNVDIKN